MPRWLITGGAGFIGAHFIRLLLAERPGVEVLNYDALTYSARGGNLDDCAGHPRYQFAHADICDHERLAAVMAWFRPDAIVHFAAESHVDRSLAQAAAFVRTNVLGTQTLIDAARGRIERFLHVSTDEVYGSLGPTGAFTEESPLAPNSPYAASKAASDLLVRAASHSHGFPAIITRASNNYGPQQFPEKLIPLAVMNALENRAVPLYGTGTNVRNWIFVGDHCRGILAALERGAPGAVYNLGGDDELENRTLLERLLGLLGKSPQLIQPVPDRPGHDLRYALDSSRARRELGWAPRVPLADGLAQTVEWYRTHPQWLARVRDAEFDDYYRQQYGAPCPPSPPARH